MLKLKLQYFSRLMQTANLLKKTLMLGKIKSRKNRGLTEDGLVGWDARLNGLSLSKLGDREGQESLLCCSPWGRKVLDKTEWLNNLEKQNFLS